MENICFNIESIEITELFGRSLGNFSVAGDIICLDGDLGTGKTTLTQAMARGLEVPAESYVTSPSFNIFHEYQGRIPLYHMDFYRLNSSDEVIEMGLDEYFYLSGLTVIEWAEKSKDILPDYRLSIRLESFGNMSRRALCSCTDPSWRKRLESIKEMIAKAH